MIAAVSEATWAFLGVLVTNIVALTALFVRTGGLRTKVDQINRAVNHQPDEAPTLVDRVKTVEERTEQLAAETNEHREWEHQAFTALAHHVGCNLPPHPKENRHA